MKILNNLTALDRRSTGEVNYKKSETIPDQATSPQELLRRYATGQPLGFKNATPVYDEDEENPIPEFYKMDKLDRLHAMQESHHDLQEKRSDFNEYVKKQKQKQEQQKADEQSAQKQKESNKNEQNTANSKRSVEHAV